MPAKITIQDVARAAGVSKVTVSYVLNGQGGIARISEATKKRVQDAAKNLGYRPNALARMLVTKRTDALAVVFQHPAYFPTWSNFTSEVMRGVCSAAVNEGFDIMLHTRSATVPEAEVDSLTDGRVDGALVLRDSDDPVLLEMLRREFPCVQFFTRSEDPNACYVDSDNFEGGRMAVRHLLELGHRRIAMVRGPLKSMSANDRFNGYREALERTGVGFDPSLVVEIKSPNEDPAPFTEMLFEENAPTAVFVWSDDVAFLCLRAARSRGFEIPRDLSIVGFDSLDACNHCDPPLTSIKQPIFLMAADATRLLVSLVNNDEPSLRKQIIIPPTLDIRGSSSEPRTNRGNPIHAEVKP